MSNERLKQFKERVKTDPEYKQHLKNRHKQRMQTDPKYKARMQAKWRRQTSKRKAKKLNTPEKLEIHQQFKLNQFKKSIMNIQELRELKKTQRDNSKAKFKARHGIDYDTYWRWKTKSGLTDVQAVIEYRNQHKPIVVKGTRDEIFKTKYGVTIWEWNKKYKPFGYSLDVLKERKYQLDRKRSELEKLKVKQEPIKIKQEISPIKQEIVTIKQPMFFNINKQSLTKESAWRTLQNKISNLNCTIWDSAIRENAINRIQQQFYQEWGAV